MSIFSSLTLLEAPVLQPIKIGEEAAGKLPMVTSSNFANYAGNFGDLISKLLGIVMAIAAVLVLLFLIQAAIQWITSGGDSGKLQKARERILHSAIGLIVLASVVAIFMLLQQFLGICVIGFGGACRGSSGGAGGPTPTPTLRACAPPYYCRDPVDCRVAGGTQLAGTPPYNCGTGMVCCSA